MKNNPVPPFPNEAMASKRVLLASNSPRRRELISMILPHFEVPRLLDIDEDYPSDLKAENVPAFLSEKKAKAYYGTLLQKDVLITADTVVILNDEILGKPKDEADAIAMLKQLSGEVHRVVTGVTVLWNCGASIDTFSCTTKVKFSTLTDEQIRNYVRIYRPFDKAGAYGIQEWIGAVGIEYIEGSYYNVMGLPVKKLYDHLRKLIN